MGELVDARTAAQRLRVDVRTLYAYVSRGSLRRVPGPDGRSSRYDSDDLALLAGRSRPRTLPRPAASIDLVIATRVSTVSDGVVRYRGVNVLDLVAAREPFERVADLLWSGAPGGWGASGERDTAGRDAASDWYAASGSDAASGWETAGGEEAAQPEASPPLDGLPVLHRFAIVVATMAEATAAAPRRPDGRAGAAQAETNWPAYGRGLIGRLSGGTADRAARASHGGEAASPVTGRLWQRWSPLPPTPARVRALNTALVLLAEHQLALSTLSVRVAASARATPSACVLAGLSTLSGALHGGAGRALHELLSRRAAGEQADMPPHAVAFGHPVHRQGDPRTGPLLDDVYRFATPADRDLIESVRQLATAPPNVDFALGALSYAARMPAEAATAIFAVARTAGWIAHAAEEYGEPPLRFRGHALDRGRNR